MFGCGPKGQTAFIRAWIHSFDGRQRQFCNGGNDHHAQQHGSAQKAGAGAAHVQADPGNEHFQAEEAIHHRRDPGHDRDDCPHERLQAGVTEVRQIQRAENAQGSGDCQRGNGHGKGPRDHWQKSETAFRGFPDSAEEQASQADFLKSRQALDDQKHQDQGNGCGADPGAGSEEKLAPSLLPAAWNTGQAGCGGKSVLQLWTARMTTRGHRTTESFRRRRSPSPALCSGLRRYWTGSRSRRCRPSRSPPVSRLPSVRNP